MLSALKKNLLSRMYLRKIYREDNSEYLDRRSLTPQVRGNEDGGHRTFLHHFLAPDGDELHNHPWKWSWSIILPWCWYDEDYFDIDKLSSIDLAVMTNPAEPVTVEQLKELGIVKSRRVRFFNFISGRRYHRITNISKSCWTIFHSGPEVGDWGFFIPGRGHVDADTWIAERTLAHQNHVP